MRTKSKRCMMLFIIQRKVDVYIPDNDNDNNDVILRVHYVIYASLIHYTKVGAFLFIPPTGQDIKPVILQKFIAVYVCMVCRCCREYEKCLKKQ